VKQPTLYVTLFVLCGVVGCDQIQQVQEQLEQAGEQVEQARDLAEYSMYYAQVGTRIGQVDQRWGTVFPQLNEAARNPPQRPAALASTQEMVDELHTVVESSRPTNANAHGGFLAAQRMVERRRAALGQLRTNWDGTTDPLESSTHLLTFSNEWMAAGHEWMRAVGQESQEVFGGPAQHARDQNQQILENAGGGTPVPPSGP